MKFTKSYLQTLSTDALLQLADQYGLFLSADLTRRLLIGELLDLDDEGTGTEDGSTAVALHPHAAVCSYNVTEIKAVLKDPIWFFVFWDFHQHLLNSVTAAKDFSSFILRVHSLNPSDRTQSLDYFDIQVPPSDRKRYIHVSFDEYLHRVDLMVLFTDGREQLLAQSNIIEMRRKNIPQRLCVSQNAANKIITLSGLAALKKSHFHHYRQAFR